jgi:hypothetical protein
MAQTVTVIQPGGQGYFAKLKLVVLNVANGAGETSITVDYATYGLAGILIASHSIRDTYTNNVQFDNATGTSVVHTWSAADVANVLVWAIGY